MGDWKDDKPYLVKDFKEYNASRPKNLQFITPKQLQKYDDKVTASQGFNVDNTPGFMCGKIVRIEKKTQEFRVAEKIAVVAAIDIGTSLEIPPLSEVKLIKANNQAVGGLMYYLTFKATSAKVRSTYQAKVWAKPSREIETLSFNIVPGSACGYDSDKICINGFNFLVSQIRSETPSLTYAKARKAASKKWRSLSQNEKMSVIDEAAKKRKKTPSPLPSVDREATERVVL